MTKLTRADTARYLLAGDHFLILTHKRPDGDTLGSAAALCLGLRQLGKTAHVLRNRDVTEKYAHLHEALAKDTAESGETLISVDVAAPNMLLPGGENLQTQIDLQIDHHGTATCFAPLTLVDAGAAACGEIIYDVLMEMGVMPDQAIANALYTAVSTDTGCFRFANVTPHTFQTAAACLEAGAECFAINQALFMTNSRPKLRLQGWIVENARFLQQGRVAVVALPRSVEEALGVREDDMENLTGFPRSIAGVKLAATLRESADGTVKISVRSVPPIDVAAVCAKLGGGGHQNAAGATVAMSLEEATDALIAALPEVL